MKQSQRIMCLIGVIVFLSSPVLADELIMAVATEPTSMDPLFQLVTTNVQLSRNVFDNLVGVGPTPEPNPEMGLAVSWRVTDDPNVWEFNLRKGVTFHDGTPFTAKDVEFSIKRARDVPNAPSTFRRIVRPVKDTKIIDDHTIHIITDGKNPLVPNYLTGLMIVCHKIGLDAEPARFNTGELTYGTGPYKFVEYVSGSHITLVANEDYWGGKPRWEKVTIRPITSAPSRVAALLAGDVDVIDRVPTTDIANLRENPRLNISQEVSNRVIYWCLDAGREVTPHITAKDGSEIQNPLRDVRVRRAFSKAIDRFTLVEDIMENVAIPCNQMVGEGFGGHDPDIEVPEFDLEGARKLMAEAGHADGFALTIHSTNDRYINDAKLAQAVAQMLAQLNLDVTVETMPVAVYYGRARKKEFTMPQIGWATMTGEASIIARSMLVSEELNNYGSYSNPRVDALLEKAWGTMDTPAREALLRDAIRTAWVEDVAAIPTHFEVNTWAARKGFRVVPNTHTLLLAEWVEKESQ